jgi:CMP-2-keto-3-deoxyoctulosonic acid synthetase
LEYKNLDVSWLENAEKIEQLRCIEQDIPIDTYEIDGEMLSVDTEEDFKKIKTIEKENFTLSIL